MRLAVYGDYIIRGPHFGSEGATHLVIHCLDLKHQHAFPSAGTEVDSSEF